MLCTQAAGKEEDFQKLLAEIESAKLEGGALDSACSALQELVSSIMLKDKILEQACGSLHPPNNMSVQRGSAACAVCIHGHIRGSGCTCMPKSSLIFSGLSSH